MPPRLRGHFLCLFEKNVIPHSDDLSEKSRIIKDGVSGTDPKYGGGNALPCGGEPNPERVKIAGDDTDVIR